MTGPRILVAGIGNIFFGDDGFGVELVRRLAERSWPEGVGLVDFGIRGLDLAYALLDGYDATILLDATPRGGAPGTLYVLEPLTVTADAPDDRSLEPHGMNPMSVLAFVRALGGRVPRLFLIGCEPQTPATEEEVVLGLSTPVAAALEPAIALVQSLVAQVCEEMAPRA